MADTLSQGAVKVLPRVRIPNDGSTGSTNALTDIKSYMNTRAKSVWERRVFGEYVIKGYLEVPANTSIISLSSITIDSGYGNAERGYDGTFSLICGVRDTNTAILPEDIGAINSVDPSLWGEISPVRFAPRGARGIDLLGTFATAKTLYFWGKGGFRDLTDSETWILGDSDALIHGATADMFMFHWEDQGLAAAHESKFENAIRLLVDRQEVQGGNKRRIVPRMSIGGNRGLDYRFKTGIR